MDKVHGSSLTGDWETPPDLVADLAPLFPWNLDACASRPNVCKCFYSPPQNGLTLPWRGLCWMNPPYGRIRHIDVWMQRARLVGQATDTTVVCLPPARTCTRWWQDNVPFADMVVFIRGRLKFVLPPVAGQISRLYPSPFPSAFVVFGELSPAQTEKLCSYGWPVFPQHGHFDYVDKEKR
jgi:phage N-6-adenine-methyltransferase